MKIGRTAKLVYRFQRRRLFCLRIRSGLIEFAIAKSSALAQCPNESKCVVKVSFNQDNLCAAGAGLAFCRWQSCSAGEDDGT